LPADCAIAAFEPVCHPPRPTDERTQESRNGDTTKGRIASTTALSLQQEPYRFNREPYRFNREPYRFNREPYRFNEGPCPRPQKVVIGARAPPSTPASVKAARPDVSSGRACSVIPPAATAGVSRRRRRRVHFAGRGRGRMHPAGRDGGDPFSHCAGGGDGRIGQRPITH
jgi:hypothetical protein